MSNKSIPLSVRLPPEDATFLADLNVPGAITPSDKLRALVQEAKRRRAGETTYADALDYFEELIANPLHTLREVEAAEGVHSDLVAQVLAWLPEAMAFVNVNLPNDATEDGRQRLIDLEAGIADRVFSLFAQVLRLGVTSRGPCYRETAVRERLPAILELNDLIKFSTDRQRRNENE
jgi:hypothetical protein